MLKKFLIVSLLMILFISSSLDSRIIANAASSTADYIKSYNDNYPAYLKHDKVLADAFLSDYNHSEAQALVARAIWYMENGYMIYGHSKYWDTGFIDCSNFVSLVYKDFGYKITSASKKYNAVGKKIDGVYSRKIKGSTKYELVGTENLKPGDILAFWVKDSDGSGTHIGHVAIYMGEIKGKPAVIQTNKDRPTAIGIRTDFRYWYGEHFLEARRVLDDASQNPEKAWQASPPVIPDIYQLPPQKPIKMPEAKYMSNKDFSGASNSQSSSPLRDITGHWAEENIKKLQKTETIQGYPDGTFKPENTISRAEFVTALVKCYNLKTKTGKAFKDTDGHWAERYIVAAKENGIISGYTKSQFGPNDPITREQMAVMLIKAAKIRTSNSNNIQDLYVDSDQISDWAKNAVLTANKENIICGYPDKTFKAQKNASRAEAVTVIVKIKYK